MIASKCRIGISLVKSIHTKPLHINKKQPSVNAYKKNHGTLEIMLKKDITNLAIFHHSLNKTKIVASILNAMALKVQCYLAVVCATDTDIWLKTCLVPIEYPYCYLMRNVMRKHAPYESLNI